MTQSSLAWQSKAVLIAVVPAIAIDVLLKTQSWIGRQPNVAVWTLGVCLLLGLVTWRLRAATPGAAAAGALITASLMFSTIQYPYTPWHTALTPVLAVSLLAYASTRAGRTKKQRFGAAVEHNGRSTSQIAANLGVAALVASELARNWIETSHRLSRLAPEQAPLFVAALAALAEAAADTVSSELGQVFGGRPRLLTNLRSVEPGTDGAISLAGTLAGVAAGVLVALAGTWALRGNTTMFAVSAAGAVFGLFFDSLLGATFERAGWLNNDAVNFLSTASAAGFALIVLAFAR